MSFFMYILYSNIRDRYYVGSCNNIEARVRKHNTNHKGFTGGIGDWKPIYHEEFPSKGEAVTREIEIKGWKSRVLIEKLIGSK